MPKRSREGSSNTRQPEEAGALLKEGFQQAGRQSGPSYVLNEGSDMAL